MSYDSCLFKSRIFFLSKVRCPILLTPRLLSESAVVNVNSVSPSTFASLKASTTLSTLAIPVVASHSPTSVAVQLAAGGGLSALNATAPDLRRSFFNPAPMAPNLDLRLAVPSSSVLLSPRLSLGLRVTSAALLSRLLPSSGTGSGELVAFDSSSFGDVERGRCVWRVGGRRLTLARLAEAALDRPAALLRVGAVGRAPNTSSKELSVGVLAALATGEDGVLGLLEEPMRAAWSMAAAALASLGAPAEVALGLVLGLEPALADGRVAGLGRGLGVGVGDPGGTGRSGLGLRAMAVGAAVTAGGLVVTGLGLGLAAVSLTTDPLETA
eukprot:m.177070 g.177070  ORF g.177070 m.177070 type:complete len:326 (+) comp16808_c0_seq1:23-1000(+)